MSTRHLIRALLVILWSSVVAGGRAEEWISVAGKSINASFRRLEGNVLFLQQGRTRYQVPLERLSSASQEQARSLQKIADAWIPAHIDKAILSEEDLIRLVNLVPRKLDGRELLMRGAVGKIGNSPLSSPLRVEAELRQGTKFMADFAGMVNSENDQKVQVAPEGVWVVEPNAPWQPGLRSYRKVFPVLQLGDVVVIHIRVDGVAETLQSFAMASAAESAAADSKVLAATPAAAPASGENELLRMLLDWWSSLMGGKAPGIETP